MNPASKDDLLGLLELQDLDARIRRLQHQLDELPEQQQLDEVASQDRALRDEQDTARIELEKVQAEQRRVEGELDLLRQRKEAEQTKLYGGGIANPRELQSLRAEIESTSRRVDEHETAVLDAMERAETFDNQIAELQARRDELAAEIERLTIARDEAASHILAEKAELEVERDQHRGQLPDDLVERYDQAAGRYTMSPFGRLVDGMCTGCRIELPVVDVNDLLDGPPLGTCPQCRRPLVTI